MIGWHRLILNEDNQKRKLIESACSRFWFKNWMCSSDNVQSLIYLETLVSGQLFCKPATLKYVIFTILSKLVHQKPKKWKESASKQKAWFVISIFYKFCAKMLICLSLFALFLKNKVCLKANVIKTKMIWWWFHCPSK